jgi:hypothetical protein
VFECRVCGGDGLTCVVPELFNFNQSTLQGFYFFNSVTVDGDSLGSDDWVAAFNGDVCVGSRQWDTSICSGGICELPVMGNDGNEFTVDYMLPGDEPNFKIYVNSENAYYNAMPSENITWSTSVFNLESLVSTGIGVVYGCTDHNACNYDENATENDGSLSTMEELGWCDCSGNISDCAGNCGGSAINDECGICNGNGIPDDKCDCDGNILDCADPPQLPAQSDILPLQSHQPNSSIVLQEPSFSVAFSS